MRYLFLLFLVFFAQPAAAQQTEARAIALQNGCRPTQISVAEQTVGTLGTITFLATCENKVPAQAGGQSTTEPKTVKIRCRGRQCYILN